MYVTVGRDIAGEPMSDRQWDLARMALRSGVLKCLVSVDEETTVEVHTGEGRWNDGVNGEGVAEESSIISFRRDSAWTEDEITNVRQYLHLSAVLLEQEAIALATGESHLIFSSVEAAGI